MKKRLSAFILVFMVAIAGITPAFAANEQETGNTEVQPAANNTDVIAFLDENSDDTIQVVSIDDIPEDADISYVEIVRSKTSVSQRIAQMGYEPEEVVKSRSYSEDFQEAANSIQRNEQTTTDFSSYGEQLEDVVFCLDNGEYVYIGPAMKELYDNVRADILKGEESVCFQDSDTSAIKDLGVSYTLSDVDSDYYGDIALDMGWLTYLCVDYDTPEMFYSNGYCSIGYGTSGSTIITYLHPLFRAGFTSLEERIELNTQLNEQVEQLVTECEQYPHVYERVQFFHDWLCENNSYNDAAVESSSYGDDVSGAPWSCVSALLSYRGDVVGPVCEGYSRAMEILCQKAEINTTVVTSESGNHMWNNLQYNESWTGVDVTWDDGDGSSYTYNYFLKKVNNMDGHVMDDSNFVDYIEYPELSEISSTEIAHIYDDPVFEWSGDKSSCVASFTCLGEDDTQTVDCTISTSETAEQYVYTATCTFKGKTYTDTVEENKSLAITEQPSDYTGVVGETATFTISAAGTDLTYQWQYCNAGGTTWKDSGMTGNRTDTLSVPITAARNGQKYRCIVADGSGNTVTSNEAVLTANEVIIITEQPEDYTGAVGSDATFTVTAEGDALTYQWQYCNAGSTNWKNSGMTGNRTDTLSVPITTARNGQKYRCIITDSSGYTATTNEATLTAVETITITGQPEDYTGAVGSNATFAVAAEGDALTYQWQYCNAGSTNWKNSGMTGNRTDTLSVPITTARNGQKYRCIITDGNGSVVTTNEAVLTAVETIIITGQPEDYTGAAGTNATFTVTAEGDNLTYQWQYCNAGSTTWRNSSMTGSQTNVLSVPITAARDGQKYRCEICDGDGNKIVSDSATIHVE